MSSGQDSPLDNLFEDLQDFSAEDLELFGVQPGNESIPVNDGDGLDFTTPTADQAAPSQSLHFLEGLDPTTHDGGPGDHFDPSVFLNPDSAGNNDYSLDFPDPDNFTLFTEADFLTAGTELASTAEGLEMGQSTAMEGDNVDATTDASAPGNVVSTDALDSAVSPAQVTAPVPTLASSTPDVHVSASSSASGMPYITAIADTNPDFAPGSARLVQETVGVAQRQGPTSRSSNDRPTPSRASSHGSQAGLGDDHGLQPPPLLHRPTPIQPVQGQLLHDRLAQIQDFHSHPSQAQPSHNRPIYTPTYRAHPAGNSPGQGHALQTRPVGNVPVQNQQVDASTIYSAPVATQLFHSPEGIIYTGPSNVIQGYGQQHPIHGQQHPIHGHPFQGYYFQSTGAPQGQGLSFQPLSGQNPVQDPSYQNMPFGAAWESLNRPIELPNINQGVGSDSTTYVNPVSTVSPSLLVRGAAQARYPIPVTPQPANTGLQPSSGEDARADAIVRQRQLQSAQQAGPSVSARQHQRRRGLQSMVHREPAWQSPTPSQQAGLRPSGQFQRIQQPSLAGYAQAQVAHHRRQLTPHRHSHPPHRESRHGSAQHTPSQQPVRPVHAQVPQGWRSYRPGTQAHAAETSQAGRTNVSTPSQPYLEDEFDDSFGLGASDDQSLEGDENEPDFGSQEDLDLADVTAPPITNYFTNIAQVRRARQDHLEQKAINDATMPTTAAERIEVVRRLFNAMTNIHDTEDYDPMTARQGQKPPLAWTNFSTGKYDVKVLQMVCWELEVREPIFVHPPAPTMLLTSCTAILLLRRYARPPIVMPVSRRLLALCPSPRRYDVYMLFCPSPCCYAHLLPFCMPPPAMHVSYRYAAFVPSCASPCRYARLTPLCLSPTALGIFYPSTRLQ